MSKRRPKANGIMAARTMRGLGVNQRRTRGAIRIRDKVRGTLRGGVRVYSHARILIDGVWATIYDLRIVDSRTLERGEVEV